MSISLEDRFWAKVNKTETCWEWTAAQQGKGYGYFYVHGASRLAHRVSYELAKGPIPEGLHIDHECHNKGCVNPAHLRVATVKQNQENRSGANKGNASGVRGVNLRKDTGKWNASVMHHGKKLHLGSFVDIAEAESAVIAKRDELFTHSSQDRAA